MVATKTTKPAQDGASAAYTFGMAAESVASDLAQATYILEPVGETIITPAKDGTDATGVTAPPGAVGIRGWLSSIFNKLNTSIGVTGTFWQATQPVSASSLPLPTGAATSAKQPALGAVGAVSADVLTTQSFSIPIVRSTSLVSSFLFKSGAGIFFDGYCLSTTVGGFYMLFDAIAAPADGAVQPLACTIVPMGGTGSFSTDGSGPAPFTTGLVGVFSTTGPYTKTASATALLSARVI